MTYEEFMEKVDASGDCWLWRGTVYGHGYGYAYSNKRIVRAHRLSYEFANGPIPKGLWVLHRCDTPACVNPDHLYAGTAKDNARDREERGRGRQPKGSRNGKAKLTEEAVSAILKDKRFQWQIAEAHNVTQSTICRIKKGEMWGHVT